MKVIIVYIIGKCGLMNKKELPESVVVSRQKAEMLYNKILPIFNDIMGMDIKSNDKLKEDEITGIVILVLHDEGYTRLNTEAIEPISYLKILSMEYSLMESLVRLQMITGISDFRGLRWEG